MATGFNNDPTDWKAELPRVITPDEVKELRAILESEVHEERE